MTHVPRTIGFTILLALTAGCLSSAAQQTRNRPASDMRMSGTYDLESTRGGHPQNAAAAATRSLPPGQRDRAYQNLLARLDPPQRFSIDRHGRTITMASNRGPRSEFDADGRTYSERGPDGRMVNTRADLSGNQLRVTTSGGNRGSDFSVTFESMNNGDNLRVTRRLDDQDLARAVTFQSYYRRVAPAPRWDVYDDRDGAFGRGGGRGNDGRDIGGGRSGFGAGALVPDGTRVAATLDTALSMRTSRDGEPFAMTIRSPGDLEGARIHGVISRVRAARGADMDLRLDFQRVEMRGRSSDFDAVVHTIRLSNGSLLRVNDDGDVRDSRTGQTVRNGAIGATVGAIIGAIAGGGKGAAIGAAIGGAGGLIVSLGREQLEVSRGADVTLTAVSQYRE